MIDALDKAMHSRARRVRHVEQPAGPWFWSRVETIGDELLSVGGRDAKGRENAYGVRRALNGNPDIEHVVIFAQLRVKDGSLGPVEICEYAIGQRPSLVAGKTREGKVRVITKEVQNIYACAGGGQVGISGVKYNDQFTISQTAADKWRRNVDGIACQADVVIVVMDGAGNPAGKLVEVPVTIDGGRLNAAIRDSLFILGFDCRTVCEPDIHIGINGYVVCGLGIRQVVEELFSSCHDGLGKIHDDTPRFGGDKAFFFCLLKQWCAFECSPQ